MNHPDFTLASASPRRRELLASLGLRFNCQPADCDESAVVGETPDELVSRLAETKARIVAQQRSDGLPVLGADTLVVLNGEAIGKPTSRTDAVAILNRLSGRQHQVMTAVALISADRSLVTLTQTQVTFRHIHQQEIETYLATGEADDKAGAYAIQGIGGCFVERIEGSYSNVVGLPLAETTALLRQAGIAVLGSC